MRAAARSKLTSGRDDVDHQIVDLLLAMMDSFKEHFVAALDAFDLPTSQGHLLMCLREPEPMSELARTMGFDASHITLIVDRLQERQLVERRPDDTDRRVKRIAITERGIAVRDDIRNALSESLPPLGKLTDAQRRQLRDLLAIAVGMTPPALGLDSPFDRKAPHAVRPDRPGTTG
ncbi:MAG: MarR family transcriptional regulator [Actinomycetota bacterium]|nr:MarR family transcriptional regulator [Actinomycetota bacterium]